MPKIVITEKGKDKESVFNFGRETVSIGRSEKNDIILPHSRVSRQHAKIIADGTDFFLIDLESDNGTYLNGVFVKPNEKCILRHNDIISIEDFNLRFHLIDELLNQSFNDITDSDILEVKLLKKVLRALDKETLPSLEVLNGNAEGKKVFITDDITEITIGRDPLTDFPIEEYVISRHHAKIVKRWGEIVIIDLNSKNGTFVNNKRVTEEVLHDGDRIALGTIVLIFRNPKEVNIEAISEQMREKRAREAPPKAEKSVEELRAENEARAKELEELGGGKGEAGGEQAGGEGAPKKEGDEEGKEEMTGPPAKETIEELSELSKKGRAETYPTPRPAKSGQRFSFAERGLIMWALFILVVAVTLIVSVLVQ